MCRYGDGRYECDDGYSVVFRHRGEILDQREVRFGGIDLRSCEEREKGIGRRMLVAKEEKGKPSKTRNIKQKRHRIGIFFSEVESELEYLVYILFGVDVSLLCLISGFFWKNRFAIMQQGLTRVLT